MIGKYSLSIGVSRNHAHFIFLFISNFELVLISCQPEDLSTTIEDSLGVISAKRVEGNTWEIKGYDELRNNLDVVLS